MFDAKLKLYRGTWCAVWREAGATRRASLRTEDGEEARRRLADWNVARNRVGGTVAEIVAAYLADKADKASAPIMAESWKPIRPVFGHLLPEHITRDLCRAYAERRRAQKRSDSTIIRELALLRAALRWHDKASAPVIEVPRQPPPRSYHLSRDEWAKFRETTKATPHIHVFAVLGYTTAGRAQAILDLTWDRVDFARGLIDLGRAQTRFKGRAVVPMNDTARAVLKETQAGALTEYVVEWAGAPVKSIKKAFARAAMRAGLPKLTPHVLRHSAAVHMAEAGIPMSEIAQYLGHSSTQVTERVYARYSPDHLRRAAKALE